MGAAVRAPVRFWAIVLANTVGNLTNGVGYVCRAFAINTTGTSDASPLSDSVSPCGSTIECNTLLRPILAVTLCYAAYTLFN